MWRKRRNSKPPSNFEVLKERHFLTKKPKKIIFFEVHRFWYQSMRNDVLNLKITNLLQLGEKKVPNLSQSKKCMGDVRGTFCCREEISVTQKRLKRSRQKFQDLLAWLSSIRTPKMSRIGEVTKKSIFNPCKKCFKKFDKITIFIHWRSRLDERITTVYNYPEFR